MSINEFILFKKIEKYLEENYAEFRVFPQISLGEVFKSNNRKAYGCINSKRSDLVIIDKRGFAVILIEYQGKGHYEGTAPIRDAVKKEICRKTNIAYIEFTSEYDESDISFHLSKILDNKLNRKSDI